MLPGLYEATVAILRIFFLLFSFLSILPYFAASLFFSFFKRSDPFDLKIRQTSLRILNLVFLRFEIEGNHSVDECWYV